MRIGSTGSRRTFALLILPIVVIFTFLRNMTTLMGSSTRLFQIFTGTLAGAGAAAVGTHKVLR